MKTKKVRFQLRWVPARSPMSCDMWQVYYGIDLICLFLLFRQNRNTRVVQVTHDCDCYDCYYHVYIYSSLLWYSCHSFTLFHLYEFQMVPDTLGHPVLIIAFVHCTMIPCIINLICCYLIMVTFCNYIESHLLQYYRLQKCLQFFFSCIYVWR